MSGTPLESLTDKRRTYTFYVDDAVLDVFGPRIGAYGIAVYTLLARHAKQKQSFPSYKHMMKQLGVSRQTITRTLDVLIREGLITKEKRQSAYGDAESNLYTLLDLSSHHDHPPGGEKQGTSLDYLPTSCEDIPTSSQGGGVGNVGTGGTSPGRLEGISIKESHRKDSREATPSKGRPPALVLEDVSTTITRKKTYFPESPEAQERLRLQVLTPTLQAWATAKGLTLDLAEEWEHFRGKAIANAYRYSDWSQAYRNWLTNDFQRPKAPARKTNAQRAQELEAWAQQQKEM